MKIFILTEGGRNKGFGHIVRCTALFDAFKEKGMTPQLIIDGDNTVSNLFKHKEYKLFNWRKNKNTIFEIIDNAHIVIVDSYLANLSFYKEVSRLAKSSVYLDDEKRLDYPRGVVLNGAVGAEKMMYSHKKGVEYLLGVKYALLRKEFWKISSKSVGEKIHNMLIAFGGDDIRNMIPKILRFLSKTTSGINKKIIVNKAFRNIKEIKNVIDEDMTIICNPSAEKVKDIMMESDLAISAGGQTLNELARVGLPTISLAVAVNQHNNLSQWKKEGFIEYIGWWEDSNLFSKLSRALKVLTLYKERVNRRNIGVGLVDGMGAHRAIEALLK